jgi:phage-related protein
MAIIAIDLTLLTTTFNDVQIVIPIVVTIAPDLKLLTTTFNDVQINGADVIPIDSVMILTNVLYDTKENSTVHIDPMTANINDTGFIKLNCTVPMNTFGSVATFQSMEVTGTLQSDQFEVSTTMNDVVVHAGGVLLPQLDRIDQDATRTRMFEIIESKYGNGYSQRTPFGSNNAAYKWDIQWSNLNEAEFLEVEKVLDDTKGSGIVYWQPYSDTKLRKWRIDKEHTSKYISGNIFSIGTTLMEVFDIL